MSRANTLSSINCTNCGAGLSVLGGGRVLTHVCGYCGSVLDTQDNYKVLASIGARNHPHSPVQIGMEMTVDGATFIVIGTIGKIERWGGNTAHWVEHQLFSETHGYAWLTFESGNFTFTRKVRDYNLGTWLSSAQVESAEAPPTRSYHGQRYRYYETSTAKIDFMEGEFNWRPELHESATTVVLLGPDAMLGLREGKTEREVEVTRLLDRDDLVAEMGLEMDTSHAAPRHPLTPYVEGPNTPFMRKVFGVSAVVALLMWAVLGLINGPSVLNAPMADIGADPQTLTFAVTDTAQLMRLKIETGINNASVTYGLRVTGPDGNLVLDGPETIAYYSGRDSDGRWSEGSQDATVRFRPDVVGPHELMVVRLNGNSGSRANFSIVAGAPTPIWVFGVMIVFLVGYIALRAKRAMFMKSRFAGGDWHEED